MDTVVDLQAPFREVFQALDLKDQRKAMRSAMRRESGRLRKMAVANMQSSGLAAPGKTWRGGKKAVYSGDKGDFKKAIRTRVYPEKYGAGFMVTVNPHKKDGYHKNRQGKEKPVLFWAEDGTRYRHAGNRVKSFPGVSFSGRKVRYYKRDGRRTGQMPRYGFLRKTEEQTARSVEQNLFGTFQKNLERAAKKKGLL